MSNRTVSLDDRLYAYLLAHSLREDDILRRLRERTLQLEMARMQIAPEQGQFMQLLVQLIGARRGIEIGTFTGYSALCMARALPEHGQLLCCDLSQEWTDIARPYWAEAGVAQRIDLRIAPAQQTLDGLLADGGAGSFDFAFIDADKTGYTGYLDACLALLRSGGLIMLDNMLWGGAVADPGQDDEDTRAIRDLNDALLVDQRVDLSLAPIGDGVSLLRKR